MIREKRESPITLHAPAAMKRAIKLAAEAEDRTVSTFVLRLVKRHLEERGLRW